MNYLYGFGEKCMPGERIVQKDKVLYEVSLFAGKSNVDLHPKCYFNRKLESM